MNNLKFAAANAGVGLSPLPSNFMNLFRPGANNAAAGILTPITALGQNLGIDVGSGPMTLGRAASILAGFQVAAMQEEAFTPFPQSAAPSAPAPAAPVPYVTIPTASGPVSIATSTPAPGFSDAGATAGGGGRVFTEEGQLGHLSIPEAGGAYSAQALGTLVNERAREIQADLDQMPEYGKYSPDSGSPTVSMLSGVRKVRQTSGYLDALLISGTAGNRATVWVHCKVQPDGAEPTDDWDDTDSGTGVSQITGKPYVVIIPEDGYLVVPIRIEGAASIGVECQDTSIRVARSRFKTQRHMAESGGGHFAALSD
ncbi:MAG TPA: hypothetical protein EYN66_13075 [Myxococcales bacterium]|nr:hypothetical protein [Myxococcales bacterium]